MTANVSNPVQLGRPMTISCNANQVKVVKIGNESINFSFNAGTSALCFKAALKETAHIHSSNSTRGWQDSVKLTVLKRKVFQSVIYVSVYQFSLFKSCNNDKQKYFVKVVTIFIGR